MCGVIGVAKRGGNVSSDIYTGLTQLQHRAHDGAGIAVYDNQTQQYHLHKDKGYVFNVFNEGILDSFQGQCGIGHVRWTTEGDINIENMHPITDKYKGENFYIAHNGEVRVDEWFYEFYGNSRSTTDTKFIAMWISRSGAENFEDAIQYACSILKGTYSFLVLFKNKIYAVRDIIGNRPLVMGAKDGTFIFASETSAFGPLECEYIGEVGRGDMIVFDQETFQYIKLPLNNFPSEMPRKLQFCLFEMIYLLRQDSIFLGRTVQLVREKMGEKLFNEHPLKADIVIGVPDSGEAAARGYARASGIPHEQGLLRSHYAGRMFIEPIVKRAHKLLIKLSVILEKVWGKIVVVVDDSIVEGRTSKKVIDMLKRAGAKAVYFLSASPMITHPCFYGVATARKHRNLIAAEYDKKNEEIRLQIGADYLGYLSLIATKNAVIETTPVISSYLPIYQDSFCDACFTGNYPIPI